MLEVTDDSGFLALVVPPTYVGFVNRDWQLDQLLNHFRRQMAKQSLLIWGTGLEGYWRVDVTLGQRSIQGAREVTGPLRVVGGAVLITNYESLTMAAAFERVTLPEPHQQDLVVSVPDGDYSCRIIQMFDPQKQESAGEAEADFVVVLSHPKEMPPVWTEIPWFSP